MKTASQRKPNRLDLVVECSCTIRTGDNRKLGEFADTVCLPMAFSFRKLEEASEKIRAAMSAGPVMRMRVIVGEEVKKRRRASAATRMDSTHPDWVLKPDPEESRHLSELLDHHAREMLIAAED